MKDFKDKIIKVFLNQESGFYSISGIFIEMSDDFLVLENTFTNKVQYISKYVIRYIEIVRDLKSGDYREE